MTVFDEMKPRSGEASALRRERNLAKQLEGLMILDDEETFRRALAEEFGITEKDRRYEQILKTWRGER